MIFSKRCVFATAAAVVVLQLPSSWVLAQSAPGDTSLDEIVVTANKRSEDMYKVPSAISVLTGARLEEQGASQFTDYFNQVPGLSAVSNGQPGHGIVSLRGVSTGATQTSATVGYYLDDVPFGSSGSLAVGGILIPDPDLFDVNRIEVLKGPQGTLYGAATLGGLIKVVRNAPDPSGYAGRVSLEGSTVSQGGSGYAARAMWNAPLSDTAAVRITLNSRRDPGFINNASRGTKDENYTNVYGGRVAFLFKPSDSITAELSAYYQDAKAHGINQTDLDPVTLKPTVRELTSAENFIRPGDDLKYHIYAAKLDFDLKFATLTSITSFGQYNDLQTTDITDNVGFGVVLPYNQQLKLDKITEEIRLASPSNQTLEWLVGAFYTHEKNTWNFDILGNDPVTLQPLVPAFNAYTFVADAKFKESAAFANATWHFIDRWSAVVGGRYSKNDQNYSYTRSGIFAGGVTSTTSGNSSDNVFNYAVALQWQVFDQTMAYARTSSGYRPGGPQVSNLTGLGLPTTFDPDKVKNYELGLKSAALDGRLQFDIAAFYIDWSDIQLLKTVVVQTSNGPVRRSLIANAGKASSRGVELNARYRPISALTLSGSMAYTNARLDEPAPALGGSAGERIPYSAKWSGTVDAAYNFPIGANLNATVGADLRYVGERYNYFSTDPAGNVRATLPAYTQADLRGSIAWETWDFIARVNNLTDKRGLISAQTNAFQAVTPFGVANDSGQFIQPRTFAIGVSKRF